MACGSLVFAATRNAVVVVAAVWHKARLETAGCLLCYAMLCYAMVLTAQNALRVVYA